MGIFLLIGLLIGVILGTAVSLPLVLGMVVLTYKHRCRRKYVWPTFVGAMALLVALFWVSVHSYPMTTVRPGNDYDVAFKNLLFSGLAYAASPGFAALFSYAATLALPRAPQFPNPPELNSTNPSDEVPFHRE